MEVMFETAHLRIRKFKREDALSLYQNHLEEEVKKWFPNESYQDLKEAESAVDFYRNCVDQQKLPYVLAVELKETGELIGDSGVSKVDGCLDEAEIGYVICRKYSGKGYATELVQAMGEFVMERFQIQVLHGRVIAGNQASVRVLEKNDYVFVQKEFGAEDDPYGQGMLVYRKNRE